MNESTGTRQPKNSSFDISINVPAQTSSKCYDDDGRLKRTGTVWTASAHIITAVIGSGVLSLAWSTAQLGWIAGPTVMFLFAIVTFYTSSLLATCYRSGDPDTGKRNYTYMDAVGANLGGFHVKLCGAIQYLNIFGIAIGYTIASSISMMAVERSNCFHSKGHESPCRVSSNPYMIAFGVVEILLSQIPDFDQIWWLSIVAAIMSLTYSTIGLGLGISKVAENGHIKGSVTGISVGTVTETQKIWKSFQALGAIAFAYSYSIILIEIQDTIKSPPAEHKTMKKATLVSVATTTLFYLLCGSFGYASFGDDSPGNLLTGFGFYNPYWLVDIANVAIVIHLIGAYQVFCQPLFAFIEKNARAIYPESEFIKKDIKIPIQSGFIKGRWIGENILLAQEMMHALDEKRRDKNIALKLDMEKAYDRVSWPYLYEILNKMGFPHRFITLISFCVERCTFSVLINGEASPKFQSARGLRQGDPLSPTLFVLEVEFLSRGLDSLLRRYSSMLYYCPKAPPLTHLAFADDILIFTNAKKQILLKLLSFLNEYMKVSGQSINQGKSLFIIGEKWRKEVENKVQQVTGFQPKHLPVTYLGVPLCKGRIKVDFFTGMILKFQASILGWVNRYLSFGGRLQLIKSVLNSYTVHLFQIIRPPNSVIQKLEQIMARFFWGSTESKK